ncbi:unnamed protein product [Paramecium sonneborni]|uniref:protein-tyrosine-phosphatase n=1 Tax=Paramecium sonneborni TaxID=65129 RepID=A0A8S1M406_9CILI|nr:unnamed protein product [Paramecium sonneborni]
MQQSQTLFRINLMDCIIQGQNNKGGLYLGNLDSAGNGYLLNHYKICSILAAMSTQEYIYDGNISSMFIRVDDADFVNLSQFFQQAFDFIDYHRQFTNVLVHCYAGISRSATIVIAYLMKTFKMSLIQAFKYVQTQRPIINPNPGFMKQLQSFEAQIFCFNFLRHSQILSNEITTFQNSLTLNQQKEFFIKNAQSQQYPINSSQFFGEFQDQNHKQQNFEKNNQMNSQYQIVSHQFLPQSQFQRIQVRQGSNNLYSNQQNFEFIQN